MNIKIIFNLIEGDIVFYKSPNSKEILIVTIINNDCEGQSRFLCQKEDGEFFYCNKDSLEDNFVSLDSDFMSYDEILLLFNIFFTVGDIITLSDKYGERLLITEYRSLDIYTSIGLEKEIILNKNNDLSSPNKTLGVVIETNNEDCHVEEYINCSLDTVGYIKKSTKKEIDLYESYKYI